MRRLHRLCAGVAMGAGLLAAVAARAPGAFAATTTDPVLVTNPSPMIVLPLSDGGGTPAWPVSVRGHVGRVADVNIVLNGPTVPDLGHYHVALTSPSGRTVVLEDGECAGQGINLLVAGFTFDDEAGAGLGDASCSAGTYRTSSVSSDLQFYSTSSGGDLSAFDGENPNGTWLLQAYNTSVSGTWVALNSGFTLALALTPETTMTNRPARRTTSLHARFEFISSKASSTFVCRLDANLPHRCTSPFRTTVNPGRHTMRITAKDSDGNVDPTPATATWRVVR